MSATALAYAVLALVALQRLSELPLSARNTKALLAQGAVETGAGHYPLIVGLHALWLMSILIFLPHPTPVYWPLLVVFALCQLLRLWVIRALGVFWTTRIISLPGALLVTTGPFRYLRHPNYLAVAGEILFLPLAFGEWSLAIIFSIANAALLAWRIRAENAVLSARRAQP
jgi:methyltransferase